MKLPYGQKIAKLMDLDKEWNASNKMMIRYSSFVKMQSHIRGKVKRSLDTYVVKYLGERMTHIPDRQTPPVIVEEPLAVGINLARNAAVHNMLYYKLGQIQLTSLLAVVLAESRRLVPIGVQQRRNDGGGRGGSGRYAASLCELDIRDSYTLAAYSRSKVKLLTLNVYDQCNVCDSLCQGWASAFHSNVDHTFQRIYRSTNSVQVCSRCAFSPDVKNRKSNRTQVRVEISNVKVVCCSLDGCPALNSVPLYEADIHSDGTTVCRQMFHATNVVSMMDTIVGRKPTGIEMKLHGRCFGGCRLCTNEVREIVKTSTNMKTILAHVATATSAKELDKSIGYSPLLLKSCIYNDVVDGGDRESCGGQQQMKYHFNEMDIFMCRNCRRTKERYFSCSNTPFAAEGVANPTGKINGSTGRSILLPKFETKHCPCCKQIIPGAKGYKQSEDRGLSCCTLRTNYTSFRDGSMYNQIKNEEKRARRELKRQKRQPKTTQSSEGTSKASVAYTHYVGQDYRDEGSCISCVVEFVTSVCRAAKRRRTRENTNAAIELDTKQLADILTRYTCRGCLLKLSCSHHSIRHYHFLNAMMDSGVTSEVEFHIFEQVTIHTVIRRMLNRLNIV